ncbi:MAG: glycosyltransferase, partial [Oscillibacter sp.]|nr:glycosyltransferase [Oscillibacter sp.]
MERKEITVTVDMLVYNHGKYLRKAIESILMQKGDFRLELLIHDDASTDDSPAIIREYQERYPETVKPILQTENQLSQGVSIFGKFEIPRYTGDYVAYCEGDDYWIDPKKLQKQIDFLESHPDFVAVG